MDKGLSVLMVAGWFYPDSAGGSQRVIYEMGRGLVKRRHKVTVLTAREDDRLSVRERIEGMEVVRYRVMRQGRIRFYLSSIVNSYRTLKGLSAKTSFDVVIFHHPLAALGASFALRPGKPLTIYFFYGPGSKEYLVKATSEAAERSLLVRGVKAVERCLVSKLLQAIGKRNLKSCQKVVVLSEYSRGLVEEFYGIPGSKITQIPAGVDTGKFHPVSDKKKIRRKLGLPEEKFILLSIRRLDYRMGLENLILAVSKLPSECGDLLLLIGGQGRLMAKLSGIVNSLGLEKEIKFLGLVEEEELPLYYQAADLFILPSESLESFGMVTLEALSSGLPVLGTPVGATPEILRRLREDLLFDGTNADSIVELVNKYVTHPDQTRGLANECRDYVLENYSWEAFWDRLEGILWRKMKILQVITGLNVGGAESALLDMASNLNPEKYEVLVCCLKEEGLAARRMSEKGIGVFDMKMKGFFDFRVIFKLVRLIRKEGIDLVHTHLARADAVGCLAAKIAGVPVISTRHNAYEAWEKNFPLTYLYHLMLSSTDAIIAVSRSAKDYLTSWARVNESKVLVIPNGVNLDEFSPAPRDATSKKSLGLPADSTVVGTIGRLDDLK